MKITLISLLGATFLMCSCGKKVEEANPDFVGFWNGQDNVKTYTIRIEEDGEGRYSDMGGGETTNAEGRVRYRNGSLRFGAFKSVEVNTYPTLVGGQWIMKVEGIDYVKVE